MTVKHNIWFILSQEIMNKSLFNKIMSYLSLSQTTANMYDPLILYIRRFHIKTKRLLDFFRDKLFNALTPYDYTWIIISFFFLEKLTMSLVWPAICDLTVFYADILLRVKKKYEHILSIAANDFTIKQYIIRLL